jgi:uncharacterized protein (DUF885 family)
MALSPIDATHQGEPGHDHLLDDFSPAGYAARAALRQETLAALAAATPVDDIDRVTLAAMRERLGLAEEIYAAGLDELDCNVLASPMQSIRSVFDLMDTSDDVSRTVFAVRLTKVAPALEQWTESLAAAAAKGLVPARRQVLACITQCEQFTSDDGYFAGLVDTHVGDGDVARVARRDGGRGFGRRAAAYVDLGTRLREQVLPTATETDAVGARTLFAVLPATSSGRRWTWKRPTAGGRRSWPGSRRCGPTWPIRSCRDRRRPRRLPISTPTRGFRLDGVDALREWMQARGDEAIAELADTHFDIPGPVRVLEGHDRPDADGAGLYYTGPSDDFSRAGAGCGGRWPKGVTEFSTWRELTTVYHEGRSPAITSRSRRRSTARRR